MAICSICHDHKPCHFAGTDAPRCSNCTNRMAHVPCSRCGITRAVWGRAENGDGLCESCSRRREPCVTCGRSMRVYGRIPAGPLCTICFRKNPASRRSCIQWDSNERLHHYGLCPACWTASRTQKPRRICVPPSSRRVSYHPAMNNWSPSSTGSTRPCRRSQTSTNASCSNAPPSGSTSADSDGAPAANISPEDRPPPLGMTSAPPSNCSTGSKSTDKALRPATRTTSISGSRSTPAHAWTSERCCWGCDGRRRRGLVLRPHRCAGFRQVEAALRR